MYYFAYNIFHITQKVTISTLGQTVILTFPYLQVQDGRGPFQLQGYRKMAPPSFPSHFPHLFSHPILEEQENGPSHFPLPFSPPILREQEDSPSHFPLPFSPPIFPSIKKLRDSPVGNRRMGPPISCRMRRGCPALPDMEMRG